MISLIVTIQISDSSKVVEVVIEVDFDKNGLSSSVESKMSTMGIVPSVIMNGLIQGSLMVRR